MYTANPDQEGVWKVSGRNGISFGCALLSPSPRDPRSCKDHPKLGIPLM